MSLAICARQALWFVGLPGSGKSTVARTVHAMLLARGASARLLEMDERRKAYVPAPEYTQKERARAYGMFVDEAAALVEEGFCVLMDGTANELALRQAARERIVRFAEVYVSCSLETAMRRESERPRGKVKAELYAKALERKRTGKEIPGLGQVVGVDVPFEENPAAEIKLDSERLSAEESARRVLTWLESMRGEAQS